MKIRRAEVRDIPKIGELLLQVHLVHSKERPDIFKSGSRKYTDEELALIIADGERPIYVAEADGEVLGYAFCVLEEVKDDRSLSDRKSLYIDDICVDERKRGKHIGQALYHHVTEEAKRLGCYHITLNVWSLNPSALRFYEKMGLVPLKLTMEKIL